MIVTGYTTRDKQVRMAKNKDATAAPTSAKIDASTRERILGLAIQRFSVNSYESTSLRELASAVGVDVAYVHRCFGSKEKLFAEAIRATIQPERVLGADVADIVTTLARDALQRADPDEVRPLDIVYRSFSSPDASRVLHDVIMQDLVAQIAERRPDASEREATLVIAFLAGLGILRDVIRAEPVLDKKGGELEMIVNDVIEGILSGAFRKRG
jgi:AcrR family transcriptional regulator